MNLKNTTKPYPIEITIKYTITGGEQKVEKYALNDRLTKWEFYEHYVNLLNRKDVIKMECIRHREEGDRKVNMSNIIKSTFRAYLNQFNNRNSLTDDIKAWMKVIDDNMDKVEM